MDSESQQTKGVKMMVCTAKVVDETGPTSPQSLSA